MKTLTIFTPTYNRAFCLFNCYDSLLRQTSKDFKWLIIDDGSTDNTKSLVNNWISEEKIKIEYLFQENQGMHGGHNTAYDLIETELNVCIDSDDFMPDDAVEHIISFWKKNETNKYAGIVGLDSNIKGQIIGTKIPEHIRQSTLYDLYNKYGVKGDKKIVYRTDIIKKYPKYPIFKNERFVPLGYLYQLIDQEYKLLTLNKVLCIVEYMEDGSSMNILKQYKKNPQGFAFSRRSRMSLAQNFKDQFKNAIHYVSSSVFNKNFNFINESPKKLTTLLAIPFGILLYLYIRYKTKK